MAFKKQNRNDFVVNPISGRLIKVNSKLYFQLVKDKILKLDNSTRINKIIYTGENAEEVKKNLITDDKHTLKVKDNKIYKQRKKLKMIDYIDCTVEQAINMIKNHLDEFTDDMSDKEIDEKVKELIYTGLIYIENDIKE